MKEIEKLKAGLEYCFDDEEVAALKENAIINCEIYNNMDVTDRQAKRDFLKEMLGSVGENVDIEKTFNCDNGKNIFIGDNFIGNYNLTILDVKEVYIGNDVMIGPNTTITTVGHPINPNGRRKRLAQASEVRIGNDVWIGANVCILPGVTIGNNVIIGAGAVVNRDIEDNSMAVGVPARIIKEIEKPI
ncbi:sugar O-acetyltransferase [Methanobrevibacter sp.]|uniref:sugar O-acetyltransferase n=1 Tax=Methanobrevibacter sp. TaxID=66852 RepID=UPI00388F2C96